MSVDGFIKFWKKSPTGIEFVKTIKAHLSRISSSTLSQNETRLATVSSKDRSLKVFDVVNFDVMNMLSLKFTPDVCQFIHKQEDF
mmetsp:Transcript_24177/g.18411  ORF Transcript_24177/g.18411 Transcript_24177/m.18411 type:complete len:85 (-) Transcript_24177:189-443(-)